MDLGVPGAGRSWYGQGGMTRDELFEQYVADTLDEAATAELGKLFGEDPAFAAQFAKDLVATGKFKEVGSELQRIEPKKRPKLIMGDAADLPKALQFLGVGEKPPPGFYNKTAVEESAAATAPATAVSSRTSTCQYRASPPASFTSLIVDAPSASLTSNAATFAPSADTRSAVDRPIPVAAPVTIIRLPVRSAAIRYLLIVLQDHSGWARWSGCIWFRG